MQRALADENLAILCQLDVVDVRADGSYAANGAFLALCRARYRLAPRRFDAIVPEAIVSRAAERGFALDVDARLLALCVLEIAAAEAS